MKTFSSKDSRQSIQTSDPTARGWFKAMRSDDALELLRANKNAFLLLYVIAYRAQWKQGFNRYNLEQGQALLGDHENYSLTAREYRTAKQNLQKWNFATFKTTSRGTLATLIGSRIFSILGGDGDNRKDTRETGERQTPDNQPTTTKTVKKKNTIKEGKSGPPVFEPVKRGLYQREYETMIKDAKAEIERATANPALQKRVLRKDVEARCKMLRDEANTKPEKSAENLERAANLEQDPVSYCVVLTDQGKAIVSAWKNRITEIRRAKNGQL